VCVCVCVCVCVVRVAWWKLEEIGIRWIVVAVNSTEQYGPLVRMPIPNTNSLQGTSSKEKCHGGCTARTAGRYTTVNG